MNYEQKMIQLKHRRDAMLSRCAFWHDEFLKDYKKSICAYSAEEHEDFKSYAKSSFGIYKEMRTKLYQIKNRILVEQKRENLRKLKLWIQVKRIINETSN